MGSAVLMNDYEPSAERGNMPAVNLKDEPIDDLAGVRLGNCRPWMPQACEHIGSATMRTQAPVEERRTMGKSARPFFLGNI